LQKVFSSSSQPQPRIDAGKREMLGDEIKGIGADFDMIFHVAFKISFLNAIRGRDLCECVIRFLRCPGGSRRKTVLLEISLCG
jgi:hypothetical protein